MRLARDAGDISSLFPTGVSSLLDAPHVFVRALRTALHFLGFEEMPEADRPPKAIWLDEDLMKAHWVNRRESQAAGGHGFDFDSMTQNEHVKELTRTRGRGL